MMSSLTLLVIADPTAPFLGALSRLQQDIQVVLSDDPEKLKSFAPDADAILFAHFDGDLLADVLPLANRVRWIHCLWAGVEMILKPQIIAHPAPLTNGRGVFRWPLADWVVATMLFFAGACLRNEDRSAEAPAGIVRPRFSGRPNVRSGSAQGTDGRKRLHSRGH